MIDYPQVVKEWRTRSEVATDIYDKPDLVSGLVESPTSQEEQQLWMMLDTEERKR